jgi:hypothetical protein
VLGGEHEFLAGVEVLLRPEVALEMRVRMHRGIEERRTTAQPLRHDGRIEAAE